MFNFPVRQLSSMAHFFIGAAARFSFSFYETSLSHYPVVIVTLLIRDRLLLLLYVTAPPMLAAETTKAAAGSCIK